MTLTVQRRSGFSTLLRLALLLVLGFVFLKCEAAPGAVEIEMDGTKTFEFPSNEKLFEQDPMTGQGLGKSRRKRADLVMSRSVSGIEESRITPDSTSIPFKDGKLCINGQEPFNEKEAKAAWDDWKRLVAGGRAVEVKVFLYPSPTKIQENLDPKYIDYCESKKCSFDAKTGYFICGNPTEGVFADGKHCFDGSDPPDEPPAEGGSIPNHEEQNRLANEDMGKWCATKVCNIQIRGKSPRPVCGVSPQKYSNSKGNTSIFIQPILIFFLTLLGLSSVFRNLP